MKRIGMPIICMVNDFSSIGCLMDTGSTTNIIAAGSLVGLGMEDASNETSTIILCRKKLKTKTHNVTFQIANYNSFPYSVQRQFFCNNIR